MLLCFCQLKVKKKLKNKSYFSDIVVKLLFVMSVMSLRTQPLLSVIVWLQKTDGLFTSGSLDV